MIHVHDGLLALCSNFFSFLSESLHKHHVIQVYLADHYKEIDITAVMAKSLIRRFLCLLMSNLRIEFLGTFGIRQVHSTEKCLNSPYRMRKHFQTSRSL